MSPTPRRHLRTSPSDLVTNRCFATRSGLNFDLPGFEFLICSLSSGQPNSHCLSLITSFLCLPFSLNMYVNAISLSLSSNFPAVSISLALTHICAQHQDQNTQNPPTNQKQTTNEASKQAGKQQNTPNQTRTTQIKAHKRTPTQRHGQIYSHKHRDTHSHTPTHAHRHRHRHRPRPRRRQRHRHTHTHTLVHQSSLPRWMLFVLIMYIVISHLE